MATHLFTKHVVHVGQQKTVPFTNLRAAISHPKDIRQKASFHRQKNVTQNLVRLATAPSSRPHHPAVLATQSAAADSTPANSLPTSPVTMIQQAASSVSAALDQGVLRQQVDLLLPINEKERSFTATEPDDYPCSLQKEFDVACNLTTALLQRVLGDASAEIGAKRLDDGGVEGEPCAALYLKSDPKRIAAVVYPTADRLNQIKDLAKEGSRPLLLVNPQWREEGQVISDFGIGPWKAAAMAFLGQFEPTYLLKEKRIGSPGTVNMATQARFASGGVVRILRRWDSGPEYGTHAMAADGSSQLLATVPNEPKYADLDAMIKDGRAAGLEIFKIAQQVTRVVTLPGGDEREESAVPMAAEAWEGSLSPADVEAMDKASLQRQLTAMGLPTSGKLSKLKERLLEALAEQ